jgi:hypothetical protein
MAMSKANPGHDGARLESDMSILILRLCVDGNCAGEPRRR